MWSISLGNFLGEQPTPPWTGIRGHPGAGTACSDLAMRTMWIFGAVGFSGGPARALRASPSSPPDGRRRGAEKGAARDASVEIASVFFPFPCISGKGGGSPSAGRSSGGRASERPPDPALNPGAWAPPRPRAPGPAPGRCARTPDTPACLGRVGVWAFGWQGRWADLLGGGAAGTPGAPGGGVRGPAAGEGDVLHAPGPRRPIPDPVRRKIG